MRLIQDRPMWTDEAVSCLRDSYLAGKTGQEISEILQERFGFLIAPKTVYNALDRFCKSERTAHAQEEKERTEALRASARSLSAAGNSISEISKIMGVPIFTLYYWLPAEERPQTPLTEFNVWLSRFVPVYIPEDPIVDTGKLIYELATEDCRWPIGKDADGAFRFCGCQFHRESVASKQRPYCEAHAAGDVMVAAEVSEKAKATYLNNGRVHLIKQRISNSALMAAADRRSESEHFDGMIKIAA